MTKEVRVLACIKDPHVISYNHSWLELSEDCVPPLDPRDNEIFCEPPPTIYGNCGSPAAAKSVDSKFSDTPSQNDKIVLYIQMELCERTLEDYLNDANKFHFAATKISTLAAEEYKERLRIAYEIMQGLYTVHVKHNIIHRDLTPRNIFFSRTAAIKLGDFGLAAKSQYLVKAAPSPCGLVPLESPIGADLPPKLDLSEDDSTAEEENYSTRSKSGSGLEKSVVGTKTFAAPEQTLDQGPIDQSVERLF